MIQIHTFIFNPFQENSYVLTNEKKEALIIDPGMYGQREVSIMTDFLDKNGLTPLKIINTHAHIDHILGVEALQAKYNIPFCLHQLEKPVLDSGVASATMYGLNFRVAPIINEYLVENTVIPFGESEIHLLFTPGHSPGSLSFFLPNEGAVIAGDTLFNGSIGRTDLPGGSFEVLEQSIRTQLYTLPENTNVYSGHGPITQIGYEKKSNPFVKAI